MEDLRSKLELQTGENEEAIHKLPSNFNFTFLFTPNRKHYSTRFEGFGWTTNTDSTQKKMLYLHMRNKLLLVVFLRHKFVLAIMQGK